MKCPSCGRDIEENAPFCRFCGYRLTTEKKEPKRYDRRLNISKNLGRLLKASGVIIVIAVIVVAVLFGSTMFVNIPVGNALILVDPLTKTVSGPVLGPTWYLKAPWIQGIMIYYAVDSLGMWGDGTDPFADYPAVESFTKDQLEMKVDVMVRWTLDPGMLVELYRNYPNLNWKDRTISSIVRQTMRFVTANYTAVETVEKRDFIASVMRNEILDKLNTEPSLAGVISYFEFDLRNIGLPDSYTASIEAKLVAEQQKLQSEFERERILILANATAQQAIIEADGESQAKIILANGTKQAIQMAIEAAGITNSTKIAELYLWVEGLKQMAPDVDVLIVSQGEDGTPLIYQLP